MKINRSKFLLPLSACFALSMFASPADADVIEVFGNTVTDLSAFNTIKDDGGTPGDALVSVQGGSLSFLENSGTDKPEAYIDFGNTLGGVRLDFDVEFNNAAFATLVSDPEILVRMGNDGVLPDSNSDTGFQLNFRHETDDSTNQIRATNNGTSSTSSGLGSSTGFNNVAENTAFSFTVLANNAFVDQVYTPFGGGSGTIAANTYDLFIDGNFIQNYTLGEDTGGFDRDLGFGSFGFTGSGNGDLGTEVLFDNVFIRTGDDNGLSIAAVPEPSSAALLLSGLVSLGLVRRRK